MTSPKTLTDISWPSVTDRGSGTVTDERNVCQPAVGPTLGTQDNLHFGRYICHQEVAWDFPDHQASISGFENKSTESQSVSQIF